MMVAHIVFINAVNHLLQFLMRMRVIYFQIYSTPIHNLMGVPYERKTQKHRYDFKWIPFPKSYQAQSSRQNNSRQHEISFSLEWYQLERMFSH